MKVLFANPVFHENANNVTCRRDSGKYNNLTLGAKIELAGLDGEVIRSGYVTALGVYGSVYDIPQSFIDNEHDPSCRHHLGLLTELERVYEGFGPDEAVVVIQFLPGLPQ